MNSTYPKIPEPVPKKNLFWYSNCKFNDNQYTLFNFASIYQVNEFIDEIAHLFTDQSVDKIRAQPNNLEKKMLICELISNKFIKAVDEYRFDNFRDSFSYENDIKNAFEKCFEN